MFSYICTRLTIKEAIKTCNTGVIMTNRAMLLNRLYALIVILSLTLPGLASDYVPADVVWTSPSRNSSESMPCGGHDIGMNVWVEQGDVLFYAAQSGWFDENNTLLKAGRWRLHINGRPFNSKNFEQRLCLDEGAVYIRGGGVEVRIWADVEEPVVFVTLSTQQTRQATLSYESWRYRDRAVTKDECQQCSYKWVLPNDCTTFADSISIPAAVPSDGDQHATGFFTVTGMGDHVGRLMFWHKNREQTVFDFTAQREHIAEIKDSLYNPIGALLMQGEMVAERFLFTGTSLGTYASTDYKSWNFSNKKLRNSTIAITLHAQSSTPPSSTPTLSPLISMNRSASWWHAYWQRSWIKTDGTNSEAARIVRNYELMRYLLGCNAYGLWPTKFNGGLFTFDPVYVDAAAAFTPDYRKWGGGTMTAQNQRLVYWPMLKSGDYDMMAAQLNTYLRLLPNAEAWTRHHWGHEGACFSEQMENFGLPNPAEYGKHPDGSDYGTERNAWLEYEWDTVLEFCMMGLMIPSSSADKKGVHTLAASCLRFFDEHYQHLAKQRGSKTLDADGKLIIYPGSGCETYKMAYNPSSTIAALRTVATAMGDTALMSRLPDIPLTTTTQGDTCIAPAIAWARIQNTETPQLYPVFPWRIYGVGRQHLDIARNTYQKDAHAIAMRSSKGWKQDNIWAACLGLTDEARRLTAEKLADGPYRFPAFWNAGFDWAPDLNRGGAAMIGLQEMLLQETPDGKPLLFPAWPRDWNCSFRLHASDGRIIEASITNGIITNSTF